MGTDTTGPIPPPLVVAMVGNDGAAVMPDKTVAVTPDHLPNIITQVVTPLRAVLIRAANVGVTVFLSLTTIGNLASATVGDSMPTINFKHALWFAALAALGEALKSSATILSGLEKRFPVQSGNV
jgi:hypothetical protein